MSVATPQLREILIEEEQKRLFDLESKLKCKRFGVGIALNLQCHGFMASNNYSEDRTSNRDLLEYYASAFRNRPAVSPGDASRIGRPRPIS